MKKDKAARRRISVIWARLTNSRLAVGLGPIERANISMSRESARSPSSRRTASWISPTARRRPPWTTLALLARLGFECQAFCSYAASTPGKRSSSRKSSRGGACDTWSATPQIGALPGANDLHLAWPGAGHAFQLGLDPRRWINAEEIAAFLSGCEFFLRQEPAGPGLDLRRRPGFRCLHQLVKQLGIPILFALHNFAYRDAGLFAPIDYVVVPTEFARRFYRETIGLECRELPLVMDLGRVGVGEGRPERRGQRSIKEESEGGDQSTALETVYARGRTQKPALTPK